MGAGEDDDVGALFTGISDCVLNDQFIDMVVLDHCCPAATVWFDDERCFCICFLEVVVTGAPERRRRRTDGYNAGACRADSWLYHWL